MVLGSPRRDRKGRDVVGRTVDRSVAGLTRNLHEEDMALVAVGRAPKHRAVPHSLAQELHGKAAEPGEVVGVQVGNGRTPGRVAVAARHEGSWERLPTCAWRLEAPG